MRSAVAALLVLALQAQPPAAPPVLSPQTPQSPVSPPTDEEAVRSTVQQYYDAQALKDPDKALAFWSASASPRPTREAFVAVFGEGEDQFTINVERVLIQGNEARVRVLAVRTRVTMRDGKTAGSRQTFRNAQLWRREAAGWKLLRDAPFADEIAEELIAAAPADRPALFEKHRADLRLVRNAISERATMAITLARDHARGRALFELALEISRAAGDRPGEANSLHNIAQAAYFLGDHAAATEFYQKEVELGREIDDQDAIAAGSFGLATVTYTRGEYTAALGFYREALAVYEKRDHGSAIGRALVSIGNVQYLQAEYDPALESYRRALSLLVTSMDSQGAFLARGGLARVFAAQGDIPAAIDMYGQVLADARSRLALDARLKSDVAVTLESIGELYFRIGNTDTARTNIDEARKLSETDPGALGRLASTLGLIELVAGRYEAALAAYTESRTRYEQAKAPDGVAAAWVGIGFSEAAREKWTDAIAAYKTAIRLFEAQKLNEESGRAWLGLSLAQTGLKDYPAALASAVKVRGIAQVMKSEDLAWRGAVRAGEALRKLKRIDEARAAFQEAIATINPLAADAPVNPDRRRQLDESADAWTGLAMALAAKGDAAGALAAAEARRAHIRRVHLAAFQRDITRGATPEEQAEEQTIVRELISTRAQVRAAERARKPDPARVEKLLQQLASLTTRRTEQQARLYARLPELEDWRGLRSTPMTDSIGTLVPGADGLLVEYLLGDDELLVLSIARGETSPDIAAALVPINRRELADQISKALLPATLADAVAWKQAAEPLSATLLASLHSRLTGRRHAIVVPDDLLWKVPFEALPTADGVLASKVRVTYATSLATLAAQYKAIAASPSERVTAAIVAAPVIPTEIRTQIVLTQPAWKEPDAEVVRAAAETLGRVYGESAAMHVGPDATEPSMRTAFTKADVLHVAAPFQVSGATPLLSYLVVGRAPETTDPPTPQTPQNRLDNDGRWEMRELFREKLRTQVLVVPDGSSFASAGSGGAMDTVAWAAAASGIASVVVGRWPMDGFTPNALVRAVHTDLAKGRPIGEAWAAAVTAARATGDAPAAWSGARLIGAVR